MRPKIKNALFFSYIFLHICIAFAAVKTYAYPKQDIRLQIVKDRISVEVKDRTSPEELRSIINRTFRIPVESVRSFSAGNRKIIAFVSPLNADRLQQGIEALRNEQGLLSASAVWVQPATGVRQTTDRTFLVRFRDGVGSREIKRLNKRFGVQIVKHLPENTYVLQVDPREKKNGLQMLPLYEEESSVLWVQPNFYYLDWGLLDASVDDPYWPQQWAHKNTGQQVTTGVGDDGFPPSVQGYNDADMDIDQAWDLLSEQGSQPGGSSTVLVAMLDSGIDLDHIDLDDNLFSTGKDFSPDNGDDANDIQGHGTATAGIVAAEGNNGQGVAGIAYQAQLLPVKIFSLYGSASDADIASAIDYAWQSGADILSNSWSGTTPNQAIDDAFHRARTQGRDGKGCVIVFSSGNEGHGTVSYPGYLDDVIAVGASNMFDEKKNPGSMDYQRSWGGNYGADLDFVAPTIVYTTDIAGGDGYNKNGDYFDHFGGTSASCPQVSGVVALMLSADNSLTADEIISDLKMSADRIDTYPFNSQGWNKHVGYGRVNAWQALKTVYGENGDVPVIAHIPLQSTSSVDLQAVNATITDRDGISQALLFYRTIFGTDTSSWQNITDADGPSGDTYSFMIPAQSWGTEVEYYLSATDRGNPAQSNTFPFRGSNSGPPWKLLRYHVGDFENETYTSNDVPVSLPDDNVYYTSTLDIGDGRKIVDVNATISISGNIQDYAVDLESPSGRASGIVNHNGQVEDYYSNTTLDDEAGTPITDGSSPYSGSYQPDNHLNVLDGRDASGTWTLRIFDNTYYNNGGSLDNWSLNITYIKPLHPPQVTDIPDQTIMEGESFATIALNDYVTDADNSDDEISWSAEGNTDLQVSIDPVSHIATISTPDSNWYGTESITFIATDPSLLKDSDLATFTVNAVNDAPRVSDIPDQTIDEGQSFTSITLDDYVTDVDNTDSEMTWSWSGNTDLIVHIDEQRIATIATPDSEWNGSETLTFKATDPGGLWDSDPAIFTVNAVNDAPRVSDIPDQTIDEGQSFTSIPLDNYVTDVDNTDSEMIWSWSGNTDLIVHIDEQRVVTIATPDSEWNGSETISFKATDPGGLWDSDPAIFKVNAVNDAPRVSDIPDQTIDEGQSFTSIPLDDYVTDADNTDSEMIWSWSGNTDLVVHIDEQRVATIATPDSEWNGSETISFKATDPGGLWDSDPATFTVNAVNDAPLITSQPVLNATQDIVYHYQVVAQDADDSNLKYYLLVYPGFLNIDSLSGLISGTPGNNDVGIHDVLVQVKDPQAAADSQFYQLTVDNTNDPPVVSDIPDQMIDEGQQFTEIHLNDYVEDADNADGDLSWSWKGNDRLTVSVDDQHVATIAIPDSEWSGSEAVWFIATDPGGLSDSNQAVFTVHAVNDAPHITSQPVLNATQNMLYRYQVTAQDVDDTLLVYTLIARPPFLNVDSLSGLITGTPENSDVGNHQVTVQVRDAKNASDVQSYTLQVDDTNDPPEFTAALPVLTFLEDNSLLVPFAHWYGFVNDPDTEDSQLAFSVKDDSRSLRGEIRQDSLLFSADTDWFGFDSLQLIVSDGQLNDTSSQAIRVIPVNDAPQIIDFPDSIVFKNSEQTQLDLKSYEHDIDSADSLLGWSFSVSDTLIRFQYNAENKTLLLSAPDFSGYGHLFATLRDDSNATDRDTLLIHVLKQGTGIRDITNRIPDKHQLFQNYPNPFGQAFTGSKGNSYTSIRFALSRRAGVELDIFNLNGQKVAHYTAGDLNAGYHHFRFFPTHLSSGVYVYRLKVTDTVDKRSYFYVKKMLLLK